MPTPFRIPSGSAAPSPREALGAHAPELTPLPPPRPTATSASAHPRAPPQSRRAAKPAPFWARAAPRVCPKAPPPSCGHALNVSPALGPRPTRRGTTPRAGGGGVGCRGAARGWPRELSRERGSGSGSRAGGRPPRRRRPGVAAAAGGGSARSNSGIINIISTVAGAWQQLGPRPRQEQCLRRRLRAGFAAVAPRQRSRRAGL